MPSSGVNEEIGQTEQHEDQENGGDDGNVKKSGNIDHEVIVRSSSPLNKENMDGVLHNHSKQDGDDSCEEFFDSSRVSSAANSEGRGCSDKEKGSLFCRIIRSPSFTKRGSIGNVLNSLYPNTKNEGPASRASICKSGASMGLPEANQSGTTDVPKSKNIKKSSSNAESLKAIVQKNVVDRCQGVQRARRNSIASYKPMTGALETSLRESIQNGRWNSGKAPVMSCEISCNAKRDYVSHICNGQRDPGRVKVDDKLKISNLTNPSCGMGKSQRRVDYRAASPKPIRLTNAEDLNDPQIRSQQTSCTVKGNCSSALPSRGIDPPERKSSATIIKRSPVAIVIPNDKTKEKENASEGYQVPSVVSFINSSFKPLGQEEAEEYSVMKKEEARKSSKHASHVTCYDEEGAMIRKPELGTAREPPLVEDSLPTNERFVALSERFAALKAKIRGNDMKQKSQFSSLASSQLNHCSSDMSDALEFSKCPTALETAPLGVFQDRLSGISDGLLDHKIEKTSSVEDGGRQSGTIDSQNSGVHRMAITFNIKEIERHVDKQSSKNVGRAYDYETEGDINWGRSVDENNNEMSSAVNNAPKIDVTFDGIGSRDKAALVRPESFAPRTRASVVAKLMDRKMIIRKRQSIEPKMMKRQSMVYDEYSFPESGIPRTFEQFEWIRAHVENTVLREPVRHEALTIKELLNGLSSCLSETELIAICKECSKTLRTLDALGSLPNYVSLDSVIINPSGTVKFKHLSTGISVDDYYLAPEHSKRFASEKTCVFSLGASLWSAADWRLTEAEKPSLSSSFQELLTSMTNDEPDARPSLQDVLQTCDSLQIDGEMTSRERCQALLWEYQASTAMRKEDASQRKMLEEEKKCHDTLMGSISVAASCKGFLKQTPVPQERNLFVKTEAHREQKHESDVQTLKGNSQDCGVFETTLGEADNDTVLKSESIKVKEFRNNEEETGKGIPSSFSTKDGNNNTADHKRRYSLTEEQKKQLLTLLASSKTFEVEKNKEREWDEPTNPSSKTSQEDKNVKPPSPSFYTYPHFTQTEGCIMFDPMAPASRSVSPKMFANVIDGQRSAVPNFVPIAVPVPSVTPVTMSPFWYMPQGGLMPYPQPGMSPVQFVPIDPSTASNQSVMSINGGESESFDEDPRSFQAGSSISRPDRTKVVGSSSQKSQHEQDARRSPSLQNKKASKLPRPVRQTPATKRSGSSGDEIKPRTPSPYVGRRSSLNASPGPRSEALRLNRSREDVDSSAKTKLQKRASVGSLTISKPSSTCRSSGAVHRSLSSPFRSRSNSLGQKSTGNVENRPNSAAKSRSNSPFSNMVSKFEQMSQESSNSSPRVRRSSVSSIISKFGSSSLVPGERIVKGQVKPNVAKSGNQNSSKTGHLRQSPTNDRAFDYSSTGHSGSPNEKLFSRSDSTARASPGSDERLFKIASVGQGQESGSGESKRGDLTVQSRHGLLLSGQSSSTKTTEAGPGSLSGNINKWSSQGNLLNDDKSHTFPISALSLEDDSINCQVIPGDKVSFSIERETDCVENSSGSYLTELSRRSSLDSEPVREKGSSKSGPKDAHVAPERDISKQPFDVKDPIGFLRSPNSNAKKFEVPVGLTMLESTDRPAFPSALHSLCGVSGGKEGGSAFPSAPLNAGGLKEIKLFDCAANSNFKCGEMKPERDSNCLEKGNSCDKDVNFNCASVSHVERFERKVLRSMGGAEDELLLCSSRSDGKQGATSKGENSDSCSSKVLQHDLANIEKGTTKEGNHLSSVAISATQSINDCKTSKARSVVDTVTASKNPRGNGQPAEERSRASSSRNPRSPLTLRKLPSNPLPKGGDESRVTAVMDKQNSLPGSKATKALTKSDNRLNSQGVVLHPNSSLGQKQTQKQSSARDISSTFLSKNPTLAHEKKIELLGKNNPNSKLASILHPKEKDIKPKTSTSTISLSNKATDSLSSVLLERKPNSSDARQDEKANLEASSASNTVRFPYTRRASTPLKESSTVKLPTKSANNPTSRHDPKQTKDKDFFALQSTYPGNSSGSKTSCTSNIDHTNDGLKSVHPDFGKPKGLLESNEVNRMASSSVGSSHRASHAATKFVDQTVSELNLGDSGVFYVSSFEEKTSKGKLVSPAKRFPSSGSSDSGLNMSDSEDTRKSDGNQNKEYKSVAPTTRNYIRPPQTPSSPKFEMGSIIFYNPKDRHDNTSLISERGSTGAESEPGHLVNVLSSGESKEAPTFLKNSSQDSSYSPNKTVGNDGDRLKNVKGLVSSIPNSPGANDTANSHGDKPKDARTTAKVGSVADLLKLTSKDRLPSPTLPPDIPGKPTSKSPPSASSVASKELLGQLVKKVLNSAAAKQGSSPKESFAESTSLTAIEDDKERQSIHGTMSLSPRETSEAKGKAKSNTKGVCNTTGNLNQAQAYRDSNETSKGRVEKVATVSQISDAGFSLGLREDLVTSGNVSETESSPRLIVEQSLGTTEEDMLSKIVDLIHDEFAFDGYLDDGVEDVNMAEYVLSLAGMSEENFKEAVTDQFSDLYWDEDLLRAMYETLVDGQQTRRSSESTVSDMSRSESSNLSREESYLSLEPLYVNSISRSSSERSGTGARDVLVSPLGETTEFLPIKVIAPDMQGDILGLLNPIFEDYHRTMGIKLASSAEDLLDKLGTKIMEISQQLTLERRAKKKNMTAYNKTADAENKKDMKELSLKLVTEIEQSDKKIVYLKHIQWKLRNVYAERFGLDTLLLHSFLVSYNKTCVTLEPEYNNSFLNFSPIWNQRINENSEIVDESSFGPSLQSGTKLGLFSYLFDRHAMSQSFVRYFFYTYRYVATSQELFNFIRDKCTASLRTDSSGQVYNHQLQIRYRALDLMSDWIDGYYQFDFKSNPKLIEELLAFVKDELILVDRSERGHFLMEIVAEKQKQDSNNNSLSEESMDSVAVLQLEDPHGLNLMVGKKDSPRKPLGSRKSKSPVQCFRRASSETKTAYKATLYLKALSVLDHSSRILAEQLTLIQQDLFTDIHPVHFLNSRVHGIGVGRCQSPTRERDSIFGFSTGNCRLSEFSAPDQGPLSLGNNLYVSEPTSDGTLEQVLEHSQDVSLWIAVEICSASSVKVLRAISEIVKPKATCDMFVCLQRRLEDMLMEQAQLALITKFVNAAHYCCEIRNFATCLQIIDALEMFVVRHLPVWKQVPTKTTEILEELKAMKVLLKTDSSWLMRGESSREKPTIPCFLLFVIHVQQQELGGFTLPSDMYKWTKMRCVARLVDQLRLFKQMRYAFQADEELKERLKQRIHECKNENLHALASENASNFHLSSSHGSRKFHDALKKMRASFGGFS